MLPELDGRAVIRAVRRDDEAAATPIIILSARGSTIDRIAGLEDGADDYLPKPFSPAELVLRVKSILRRATPATRGATSATATAARPLVRSRSSATATSSLDPDRHEVRQAGRPIDLTRGRVPAARDPPRGRRPGPLAATSCSTRSTATTAPRSSTAPSMSTSAGCATSSATMPSARATWPRSAASAIGPRRIDPAGLMGRGIAVRIALAALASAAVGLVILAVGVAVVGADVFTALMVEAGDSAEHARAMYDQSVTVVVVAAVVVAALASIVLAIVLARMLARPLAEVGAAARRVAEGDYAARVPREGPEELASLADSFNQMAASLERQEAMRRDFIANAAHELRTPLTNLQGYLEALRDGVITADRATYESLLRGGRPPGPAVALARCARRRRRGGRRAGHDRARPGGGRPHGARPRPACTRARRTPRRDGAARTAFRHGRTPTSWPRSWRTCSRTRPATRRPAAPSRSAPSADRPTCSSRSSNTGDGIPPDDLERVFERFYRVEKSRDRARGGAGIGLAIVKQLVEAAGGRVGAESATARPGSGSACPASE